MESVPNLVDKIYSRIESLKQYTSILEGLQNITLAELKKDPIKKGAIERYLQLSIEVCIDIAEMIISDQWTLLKTLAVIKLPQFLAELRQKTSSTFILSCGKNCLLFRNSY